MSSIVEQRHAALRHHLSPRDAARSVDEAWLRARFADYCAATQITADLYLTREGYTAATGMRAHPDDIGTAYRGRDGARSCVFLDAPRIITRGTAELEIAHEIMHLRWWSYGHSARAFARAQTLLDAMNCPRALLSSAL